MIRREIRTSEEIVNQINNFYSSDMYNKQQIWKKLYKGDKPQSIYKGRRKKYLNMVGIASREMSSLILNEKVKISINNEVAEEFFNQEVGEDEFIQQLQPRIEQMFAMGGIGGEVIYDSTDGIEFNLISADRVIPLAWKANGDITDIAFIIDERVVEDKAYILVRTHERTNRGYVITNRSYEISNSKIKEEVSLQKAFPELDGMGEVIVGARQPLFAYTKPNIGNRIDFNSPLGVSIIADAIPVLEAIDIKYDGLSHEFETGRKKYAISRDYLPTDRGTGEVIIPSDIDFFVPLARGSVEDKRIMEEMKFELRVNEYKSGLEQDLDILAMHIGFNAGTFTPDDKKMMTATEVISSNSATFRTKQSHQINITYFIQQLVKASLYLGYELNLLHNISIEEIEDLIVDVEYDDSIVKDKAKDIDTEIVKFNNGLTTRVKALMEIHNITKEEAEDLEKQIKEEQHLLVPDIADFIGRDD